MKLKATGQTLELVEPERLISGSVEIYTAAFEFDAAMGQAQPPSRPQ